MPPTPQLGHLAQELVSPMVKEEVQEDFSALKDEAGVEVGCRGEVRTHIHTYKPMFLSCAFPRCVCKEDQVVFLVCGSSMFRCCQHRLLEKMHTSVSEAAKGEGNPGCRHKLRCC